MLRAILIKWAIIAVAFAVTAKLLDGVSINGGFWAYVWVSLLFGIINVFIGTILRLITLPLTILTFGLFYFVVNALLLWMASGLVPGFNVAGFGPALLGSVVLTLVNAALRHLVAA